MHMDSFDLNSAAVNRAFILQTDSCSRQEMFLSVVTRYITFVVLHFYRHSMQNHYHDLVQCPTFTSAYVMVRGKPHRKQGLCIEACVSFAIHGSSPADPQPCQTVCPVETPSALPSQVRSILASSPEKNQK